VEREKRQKALTAVDGGIGYKLADSFSGEKGIF
jgi:hypothetical protein